MSNEDDEIERKWQEVEEEKKKMWIFFIYLLVFDHPPITPMHPAPILSITFCMFFVFSAGCSAGAGAIE